MKVTGLGATLALQFGVAAAKPLVPARVSGQRRLAAGAARLPVRQARAQG
jgi:hypothetical protein